MQVIRRYTTKVEIPLVKAKITPAAFRADAHSQIVANLNEWIKMNEGTGIDKHKFEIFTRLYQNPIRQNIPEMPAEMMTIRFNQIEESKRVEYVEYFRDLVRFSYPNKFTKLYAEIKNILNKFKAYPEIKDEYFYFNVKKNNDKIVNALLKEDYYVESPKTYISQLRGVELAKNSGGSLSELRGLTRRLIKHKIPVSRELLYNLYYAIPRNCRGPIKDIYTPPDVENNYAKPFDEWKIILTKNTVPFTYASYIQLINAMVDEHRISEGLNLLYKLTVFYKVEIPPSLAKFTIDKIVAQEPELALPAALFMQRISGCQLKQYAAYKLTYNLVASHKYTPEVLTLIKLLTKYNAQDRSKFIGKVVQRIGTDSGLAKAWEDPIDSEIDELFKTQYFGNDNYFKPGNIKVDISPIVNLFLTNVKAKNFVSEIKDMIAEKQVPNVSIWDEKLSMVKNDRLLFIKGCDFVIGNLIKNNEYKHVIEFVELLKPEFDLSYTSNLKLIDSFLERKSVDEEELKFCSMLLNNLELYHSSFTKEYLNKYPVLSKLLDVTNDDVSKKLLSKIWVEYVTELKKDASFENILNKLK